MAGYGKAGLESAAQLLGNAFFDYGSLGAEALSSPSLFARGFGDKDAAEEFARLKEQRRSSLPTIGASEGTEDIQKALLEQLSGVAKEQYGKFQAWAPEGSDALEQYFGDPRVQHTLGALELGAPSGGRAAKALNERPNIDLTPSATGTSGSQKGAVSLLGDVPPEIDTELERIMAARADLPDYHNEIEFLHRKPAEVDVEERVKSTGHYRGAPGGMNSPQSLGSMRTRLKGMLLEGMPGKYWYDKSSDAMIDNTGGQKGFQHLAAGANAITSRGSSVDVNQNFGIHGYNNAILQRPTRAGRFGQGGDINTLADGSFTGGPKEGPFYEALTIRDRPEGVRPTNDIWMARAFGYKKIDPKTGKEVEWTEGLGDAQHRFMDKEIKKLTEEANKYKIGGQDDWTPERVQASIWTSIKSRTEGTTVEKAAGDFSDNLENLTAHNRYEINPSKELNHRREIGATEEYNDLMSAMLEDDTGRNRISMGLGMQTLPTARGKGEYGGVVSPSNDVPFLAAPETGTQQLSGAGSDLSRAHASITGMVTGQETMGNTFLRNPTADYPTNAAFVNTGSAPDSDGMMQIKQALIDNGMEGKVYPLHTKDGVQFVQDPFEDINLKDFQKAMRNIAKSLGGKPEYKHNSGNGLMGNTDFDGFRPSAWMRELDSSNLDEHTMSRADYMFRDTSGSAFDIDTLLDSTGIDTSDPILMLTREIGRKEGFEGIRKAVKDKVLPVAVLGLLGIQAGGEEQNAGGPF